jgi:hypothetical protein
MATAAAVLARFRAQDAAVRARVVDFVTRTWFGLGDWRDADIDRFAAAVVPVVAGGQIRVASLTDAYLAQVETAVLGIPTGPVGVPRGLVLVDAIRGVDPAEVYRRPALELYTALAAGIAFPAALAAARARAEELALSDLQLAKTHAARYVLDGKDNVETYQRVADGNACELCAGADGETYHSSDVMPIHARCGCDVVPVFDGHRPEPIEPPDDVEPPVVHEHGELGPVLAAAGADFTGPDDI